MPQILQTVLEPAQALAAAAENLRYDLPVNPLSVIIVTLRALNNNATPGAYLPDPASLLNKLSNTRVRYRGATILDGAPIDLIMAQARTSRWWPIQAQVNNDNNDQRALSFPLLFGRKAYDPKECFPATRRGDLTFELDTIADPVGLDGYTLQMETIELLDAKPERFVKITTTQRLLEAGDVNDIQLPIGNKLLGVLLRGDTFPNGANNTASFREIALEVDNVEVAYSRALWLALQALWARRTRLDWLAQGHVHLIDGSAAAPAAYAQATTIAISADADGANLTTGTAARSGILGITPAPEQATAQRYGYLDLDPLEDLQYALDTVNAADVSLHVNSDVTDATASRVLPIEYVVVTPAAPAA